MTDPEPAPEPQPKPTPTPEPKPELAPAPGAPWRARLDRDILVLLVVTVLAFSFDSFVDPDLPGHLAFGLDHLERGVLANTDPYSYTAPGQPWINHEWLFELTIAGIWSVAGDTGLVLLQALAWLGSGLLILRLVRRSTTDLLPGAVSYLLFLAGVVAAITIRPQLFTYLFFALELWLLERARTGQRSALLLVPPLIAVWTNVHGGFLAGLGVLGLYSAGLVLDPLLGRAAPGDLARQDPEPRRTAVFACAAVVLAIAGTLLNPYGWHLHEWLRWSLVMPNPFVSEWRPMRLLAPEGGVSLHDAACLAFMLLVGAALLLRDRRRTPLAHAVVLGVTAILAVRHVRHVPFFAMSAAAFAPGAISDLYRRFVPRPDDDDDVDPRDARRLRGLFVVMGAAAIVGKLLWPSPTHELHLWLEAKHQWPTGAIAHIDRRLADGAPERRLQVFFDWAQLAIWRWHPRLEVFYDGRHRTVYMAGRDGVIGREMPHVERLHFELLLAPGDARHDPRVDWREALSYPPDRPAELVLLPLDGPGTARMRTHPDFRVEFEDELSVLFVRRRPGEPDVPPVRGPSPPVKELPFGPRPGLGR